MPDIITSKTNSKIKYITSLHNPKYRKEHKQFLAEGFNALTMALAADRVKDIYALHDILDLDPKINIYLVTEEIMDRKMSNYCQESSKLVKFRSWKMQVARVYLKTTKEFLEQE